MSANGHTTKKYHNLLTCIFNLMYRIYLMYQNLHDTTEFLGKEYAMGPLPSETLLVSMDVTSLYTNIPHEDGIKACEDVWETQPVKNHTAQFLVKLLELQCNNFEFNGKNCLKIQGTAMGTKWLHHIHIYEWVGWKNGCYSQ